VQPEEPQPEACIVVPFTADVVVTTGGAQAAPVDGAAGGASGHVADEKDELLPATTVIVAAGPPHGMVRLPDEDRAHPDGTVPLVPQVQPEEPQPVAVSWVVVDGRTPLAVSGVVITGAAGHVSL